MLTFPEQDGAIFKLHIFNVTCYSIFDHTHIHYQVYSFSASVLNTTSYHIGIEGGVHKVGGFQFIQTEHSQTA